MLEFLGLFASLAELLGYIAQLGKLANFNKVNLATTARLVFFAQLASSFGCVCSLPTLLPHFSLQFSIHVHENRYKCAKSNCS